MSNKIDDGGPAFPHDNQELGEKHRIAQPGMFLRDYFAAKAMQASRSRRSTYETWADLAADSYEIADAMLTERAKERKST